MTPTHTHTPSPNARPFLYTFDDTVSDRVCNIADNDAEHFRRQQWLPPHTPAWIRTPNAVQRRQPRHSDVNTNAVADIVAVSSPSSLTTPPPTTEDLPAPTQRWHLPTVPDDRTYQSANIVSDTQRLSLQCHAANRSHQPRRNTRIHPPSSTNAPTFSPTLSLTPSAYVSNAIPPTSPTLSPTTPPPTSPTPFTEASNNPTTRPASPTKPGGLSSMHARAARVRHPFSAGRPPLLQPSLADWASQPGHHNSAAQKGFTHLAPYPILELFTPYGASTARSTHCLHPDSFRYPPSTPRTVNFVPHLHFYLELCAHAWGGVHTF